jgi:hypothetical protein
MPVSPRLKATTTRPVLDIAGAGDSVVQMRQPSCLSSKIQSGWSNACGRRVGASGVMRGSSGTTQRLAGDEREGDRFLRARGASRRT